MNKWSFELHSAEAETIVSGTNPFNMFRPTCSVIESPIPASRNPSRSACRMWCAEYIYGMCRIQEPESKIVGERQSRGAGPRACSPCNGSIEDKRSTLHLEQ